MKLFVWDFHGVLEKDNDLAVLEISNRVLAQKGHKERFSTEDNRSYYGLKWYEYFERLLPHLGSNEHMALQAACFTYSEEHLDVLAKYIKTNDHAIEVLRTIHEAGHDQILLSNTRPHDLTWFIETVGLREYFPEDKVFGVNAHEKLGNKIEALRQYLYGKTFDDIIIIGDSEKDMLLNEVQGGVTYFYTHPHLVQNLSIVADHTISDLRIVLNEL